MQISRNDWLRYLRRLGAVDRRAAFRMQVWMERRPDAGREDLISAAYSLASVYGEAAAALACEMYDATAAAQKVSLPPAVPAQTATWDETARAVMGTIKNQRNTVPATVGRLVKQAGADTMLHNAQRDGAEWAWVPNGDTCAFCVMLASNGWQRHGKKAARGQHAEHIHANCDCTYAVRFDGKSTVEGYGNGERYLETYNSADGRSWRDKLNSMRREQYAADHSGDN